MVSARTLLLVASCCCSYAWLARAEDSSLETRSSDFSLKTQQEKDLVRAFKETWLWKLVLSDLKAHTGKVLELSESLNFKRQAV